jgi:hypothetical protein
LNNKKDTLVCLLGMIGSLLLLSNPVLAQGFGGSGFEGRLQGFTNNLISVILPAISILGLVYAAMLAASGDEGAKKRMILVCLASVVGMLAPVVIRWLQSAVGG